MKFVALLSGGKDSVFSIEKCLENSHELVCVANLYPPPDPDRHGDEINSYMYQSAAYSAIPMQAECLGVPLVRREILGLAKLQTLNYEATENDETEDLFALLKDVQARFPDVKGVSCGTIISNYQRFRVENTCKRLGLTPLSYLWQRDRGELLQEMLEGGLEAVLVKTAGAGLVPDKHLGKTLNNLYPTLRRLHERFELDLCGEGGEYESLVLDSRVFKRALVLTETVIDYDAEDDSVGCLRIIACETRAKLHQEKNIFGDIEVRKRKMQEEMLLGSKAMHVMLPPLPPPCSESSALLYLPHLTFSPDGLLCQTGLLLPSPITSSPGDQLLQVLQGLSCGLAKSGQDIKDTVFVHLYVSDMGQFEEINDQYGKWFGINPPSRSCVQVDCLESSVQGMCCLPQGVHVAVECLVLLGSHQPHFLGVKTATREVLHVRSVSAWAPVCIGPYAQANIIYDSVIFVAGQIALQPSTMTLIGEDENDALIPWHPLLIASLVKEVAAQRLRADTILPSPSSATCSRQGAILSMVLRELFLSLFHVNSILSALASNTPSLPLTPSATLLLVIYVDVQACARKYYHSLTDSERAICGALNSISDDVHALFSTFKICALHYIERFIDSVTEYKKELKKIDQDEMPECESEDSELSEDGESVVVPTVVLGVESLPRKALVEVELIGATAALQSKTRTTCPTGGMTVSHEADQNEDHDQDQASLSHASLCKAQTHTALPIIHPSLYSSKLRQASTASWCIDSEAISCSSSICCGAYLVSLQGGEENEGNDVNYCDLWSLADLAVRHLNDILTSTSMHDTSSDGNFTAYLRLMKIYIPTRYYDVWVRSDIHSSFVRALGKVLGCFELDPIIIPVTQLEANRNVLAVQFVSMNLEKMNV